MRPALLLASALAAFALEGTLAADAPPAGQEPVQLTADHVDLDVAAKTATLTGHVQLDKGPLTVRCPRVDVRYDEIPHVTWAKGSGGVAAELRGIKAEAPEVEIDLAAQRMDLRGGVRIARGEGWLAAEQASVQLTTGKVTLTGVKGSMPAPKPAP